MAKPDAPVAFFVFNRPKPTSEVFNAIRAARPSRLLVVADGPRAGRDGEEQICATVRSIIDQVDWPCEVQRNFSDVNLGCRHRLASGLSWVFEQVEQAIILEDDCLPDPTFFPYCTELLERYQDDCRVMAISGANFGFGRERDYGYYFSRFLHIWGWASWRRAWSLYDVDMKRWPAMRDEGWLRDLFPSPRAYQSWWSSFEATFDGRINSWDFQLVFAAFSNRMLGITPTRNLVRNIGFGHDATHTVGYLPFAELPLESISLPLRHPPFMIRDQQADQCTQDAAYSAPRLLERVRRKIVRTIRGMKR